MYTTDRPTAETAPPHATVYVERPLPFVLRPGDSITYNKYRRILRMLNRRMQHIERLEKREREFTEQVASLLGRRLTSGEPLAAADVELIEAIFRREDALLRTFYDREKEFTRDIGALQRGLEGRATHGLAILGPLRLVEPPLGHSEDNWAAPVVEIGFTLSKPVQTLTVHGSVPDSIPDGQVLRCTIGGQEWSMPLGPGAFRWTIPVSLTADEPLTMTLHASIAICPARDIPGATDPRELAYHLLAVEAAEHAG